MKNEGAYTLSIEFEPFDVGDVRIQRLLYKHLLTLEPERLRIVTFGLISTCVIQKFISYF